jgi:dTDP-4-amino-4,6-dideoxygalactose transaminase
MTVRQVPLLDLRRDSATVDGELEDAFQRVLKSGQYILGPEVEGLERECGEYIGARHSIGVSSGTDALLLALMALGIGAGDEVICPTYTFFATAGVVSRAGATPVFADIAPCCYNMSSTSVASRVTSKTKAIIPVHLYGQCSDLDPLLEVARAEGIAVIEDAAQAIGARYKSHGAGTLGAFGCFSFFPSKNVGALGDAGLLTTNDNALAEKALIMRTHGSRPKYYHHVVGGNFRMDALQAAFLRVKMKRLDDCTRRRQENAKLYSRLFAQAGLGGPSATKTCRGETVAAAAVARPVLLPIECHERHVYNQYVVRLPGEGTRDRLREFLRERKVGTEIYYPVPMHLQECFRKLGGAPGQLPESEAAAHETLALPIFPELRSEEIEYVVDQVAAFFS